jgi:hypothetical protein
MRVVARLLLASVGLCIVGCGSTTVSMRPAPRSFTAADYESVYEAWTREADEFEFGRLSDVLNVTATFQGWEFRWAYVVRYADDHSLRTEERAEMLRASLADARERHRFFVTLSGSRWRDTDLTSDDATWRVLLVDEQDEQTLPLEIEKMHRPSANIGAYYESVSVFRHAFRIVFPARRADGTPTIPDNARFVILRFTGPLGTVDLKWEFAH